MCNSTCTGSSCRLPFLSCRIDIYDEVNHEQGDPPKQSDDQIQLQQNVCYAATCGHKNHNTKNEWVKYFYTFTTT